jgi:signal peptidase I
MSDDWGRYRSDLGDEDEKDEKDEAVPGRDEPGGWPEDKPDTGHFRSHWPDDEPEPGSDPREESPSGWPSAGSTWERPNHGETPRRDWQRSDDPGYGDYGYTARDDHAAEERYAAGHSRDPLARLFPGLPRSVRVTLDWILTIAGAILIVLALKQWVVNPYRIPSSSMEPNLNCAKGPANPGCLGDSSDRVLACRICLDFGRNPSRGDIVVFNTPKGVADSCGEGGTFVKRVIGLPGDTIKEDDKGFIYIRGPGEKKYVKLNEPYIPAQDRLADSGHFGQTFPTVHGRPKPIPAGNYFMMGDNRSQSCDSRTWGSVPRNDLIGTVFFVYWPPDRISFR